MIKKSLGKVFHRPVLLKEVVESLGIREGGQYIEATLGGGGHTEAILKAGGKVLGIDCDPSAIQFAKKHLISTCSVDVYDWQTVQGNFVDLEKIAKDKGFDKVDGILFDLGVSSHQLGTEERGFSFRSNAKLDMRMDPSLQVTAADLVNGLNSGELYELFTKFSQEKLARPIARAIVLARNVNPIVTGVQLAEIIEPIYKKHYRGKSKIHPATKVFQALRIAINDELNNLKRGLFQAIELLEPDGRLIVISFHESEDRIVKEFFKQKAKEEILEILTKKPIGPSEREVVDNPRSRSAKLRSAKKLD